MEGKLQALRKCERDGDATGLEIRIKPLTVTKGTKAIFDLAGTDNLIKTKQRLRYRMDS